MYRCHISSSSSGRTVIRPYVNVLISWARCRLPKKSNERSHPSLFALKPTSYGDKQRLAANDCDGGGGVRVQAVAEQKLDSTRVWSGRCTIATNAAHYIRRETLLPKPDIQDLDWRTSDRRSQSSVSGPHRLCPAHIANCLSFSSALPPNPHTILQ